MQVTIDLDNSVADEILLIGLKEYHKYLVTHPFQSGEYVDRQDDYDTIVDAFEIVLQQYLTETEYNAYIASLNH